MDNLKRKIDTDPDYSDVPEISPKKARTNENEDLSQNYNNVINIFQREFQKEINYKREEVHKVQQQLLKAQKTLHLLRYVVVKSFYDRKELKPNATNEIPVLPSTSNSDPTAGLPQQNRLHPALKKLVGKKPLNYEPYRTRNKINLNSPRFRENVVRVKEEPIDNNFTQPEFCEVNIKFENVEEDEGEVGKQDDGMPVRNREKNKYTILVGNISKWIPSNSSQDNSTHKWMVYVRGPKENPDITNIVQKVRFFLHPSYQPNDIVDIQEAPFHLSRRGWGEFPIRVQIYFKNSKNKPIDVIHNIKLDRTYTGRQTMGGETLVDVWLYDREIEENPLTPTENGSRFNFDLIKTENFEEELSTYEEQFTKKKPTKINNQITANEETIVDFSKNCNVNNCDSVNYFMESCIENINELDGIDKEIKTIYEGNGDNSENKISLSSLIAPEEDYQENGLNGLLDMPLDNPMTLLNLIGVDQSILEENLPKVEYSEEDLYEDRDLDRIYLEDHCYTKLTNDVAPKEKAEPVKAPNYVIGKSNLYLDMQNLFDKDKYKIDVPLECFSSVPQIIYYLFKHMPLVTELVTDFNYTCMYPYAAVTMEQYLSWNSTKQFCAEWYRAKQIKKYLTDNKLNGHEQWTVKIILQFGQAHGFSIHRRHELFQKRSKESGKTVPNSIETLFNKNTLTELISIKELLDFKSTLKHNDIEYTDIDILETQKNQSTQTRIKHERNYSYKTIRNEQELPLNFIKQTADQIGIKLEPEEIETGVHERASESVILKAVMCLAEELVRKSLANCIIENGSKDDIEINKTDIFNVLLERKEFNIFLNLGLGKNIVT